MPRRSLVVRVLCCWGFPLVVPSVVLAEEGGEPKRLWRGGALHGAARVGWASTTESTWGLVGAGAGVFVARGLALEAAVDVWLGSPGLLVVTPGVRYVFDFVPDVHPYLGPIYRKYLPLDGFGTGSDALGARLGVLFPVDAHLYIGGGLLYEHLLDQNLFLGTDAVFPELMLGFGF